MFVRHAWLGVLVGSLLAGMQAGCASPTTPGPDASVMMEGGAPEASVGTDASAPGEDASAPGTDAGEPTTDGAARDPLVVARPFRLRAPTGADRVTPLPLVVLLHGYGANSTGQDAYFGLSDQVGPRRFLLALPDGTLDASARRFWNATDACCDFARTNVDDVAYVRAIINDVRGRYAVDPAKVYVVGHSNGGFMALRLACELSEDVTAVVSLAGAGWSDAMRCRPSRPVSILQVHGTMDAVILYPGGAIAGSTAYPGAERTVSDWAARNGCGAMRASAGPPLDLEMALPGPETTREAHAGCRPGGAAELWSITNGSHIPALSPQWATSVIDWLYAHARGM
jgi:polyhydroxybutyrate depolymerase